MTALSSALSLVLFVLLYPSKSNKYILVTQEMNGNNASSYCQTTYGTHLASIHDWNDNWEASNLCQIKPFCLSNTCKMVEMGCYIGLNDRQNERLGDRTDWVWDDGTAYDYSNWRGGEPTDGIYEADCVIIYPDTHPSVSYVTSWADVYCTTPSDLLYDNKMYFLCNMPPTMDPTSLPTNDPTLDPTIKPTIEPTQSPTFLPTMSPTFVPTDDPTNNPTFVPTNNPTKHPLTLNPNTFNPSKEPSLSTVFAAIDTVQIVYAVSILISLIIVLILLVILLCRCRNKAIVKQDMNHMTVEVADMKTKVPVSKQENIVQNILEERHGICNINIAQNTNHMMVEAKDTKEQMEQMNSMSICRENNNENNDQNVVDHKTTSGGLNIINTDLVLKGSINMTKGGFGHKDNDNTLNKDDVSDDEGIQNVVKMDDEQTDSDHGSIYENHENEPGFETASGERNKQIIHIMKNYL